MAVKRERLEVIHDILRAVQEKDGRIRPTHVMYRANLSHQMLDEYLKELIEKDLLVEKQTKNSKTFSLTDKGFEFLEKYRQMMEFVDSFGLR
jgi:predicted transcriptional regulator